MLLLEELLYNWIKLLRDLLEYLEPTSVLHHPWNSYM